MACTTNFDDLDINNDQELSRVEDILRSKYLEIIHRDKKNVNKHKYKSRIQEKMNQLLLAMNANTIDTSSHYFQMLLAMKCKGNCTITCFVCIATAQ